MSKLIAFQLNPFDKRNPIPLFSIEWREFEKRFPLIAEIENRNSVIPTDPDSIVYVYKTDGSHFKIGYYEVAYTTI